MRGIKFRGRENSGCQGLEGGKRGFLLFNGDRVSVWENEKVLELDGRDGYTTLSM